MSDVDMSRARLVASVSRQRRSSDVLVPHLRRVREMRALSQEELGKTAGVSRQTVMALEGGRNAWPSTVRKLAKALRVDPRELTGRQIGN